MTDRKRFTFIGASDIAGIVNISPWSSPLSVYHNKMHGRTSKINDAMYFGTALENFIKNEFKRRNKNLKTLTKKEMRDSGMTFLEHDQYSYICGHPDGYFVDQNGEIGILEIKTCSEYSKSEWREGIPDYYFAQVQYYLGIAKLKKAYICCLGGGNEWFQYPIRRSDDYVQYLFDKAIDFWENHILKGVAPEPTDKDFDRKILNEKILKSKEEGVINTNLIDPLVETIRESNKQIKELQAIAEEAKNKCIAIMGTKPKAKSNHNSVSYKIFDKYDLNKESKEKLKEAHPDIYKKFVVKSTSSRLNIKEIKNVRFRD